jgi:hypothetical protein
MKDSERLDWLEKQQGCALVSDDMGHWAVVCDGMQNIPDPAPGQVETSFFIGKDKWKETIREAIDSARNEWRSDT